MSIKIKNKLEVFINSVATILNSINNSLNSKVDKQIFNNQTSTFQTSLTSLTDQLNVLNQLKGIHFTSDPANNKILLKNVDNVTLTELDVTFLNNEGTTFSINNVTNNLELKNDQGVVISSVPVSNLVSNLINTVGFNATTPYKIELRRNDGTVASTTDIDIPNVKNLESRLNSIKTIYNADDILTGNRNINIGSFFLKLNSSGGTFEFTNDKLTIPSKLSTNKFGLTQNGQILDLYLNNNLPKIIFGNPDINELVLDSKSYMFKNIPAKTTQTKTLCIDDNGNLAYSNGIGTILTPGEGINIQNGVISLIPTDSVQLTFNW